MAVFITLDSCKTTEYVKRFLTENINKSDVIDKIPDNNKYIYINILEHTVYIAIYVKQSNKYSNIISITLFKSDIISISKPYMNTVMITTK